MKQSRDTDPLLEFIRQQVEQFEEIPSEKVWEGLEAGWQQPRLRGRSTLLILLVSAVATLGISAMLSWSMLFAPITAPEAATPVLLSDCEEKAMPERALTIVPATPLPLKQAVQLNRLPSLPVPALLAEIQSTAVPLPQSFVLVDTSLPISENNTDSSTNREPAPPAQKKRPSLRLGQLFQKGTKRRKGNNWDYQLGIRVGTSNFTSRLMRDFNSISSIYQVEVLGEWVLHPRFRLQTGIAYERMMFDYGSPNWGITEYQSTIAFYELPLTPNQIVDIDRKHFGHRFMLPIEVLFFITPPELETQVWAGLGFRQELFSLYRLDYEFELTEGESLVVPVESEQRSDFVNRAFLFRLGVEQRLTSALRLRLSGFYSKSIYDLLQGMPNPGNQIGGSLSLFWASKRGPMRWRNKRTKRR